MSRWKFDEDFRKHRQKTIKERRKYNREQVNKLLDDFYAFGCMNCNETHRACLEAHHRDPSQKDKAIASMLSNNCSAARVARELEKCSPLCANCHRKFHAGLDVKT